MSYIEISHATASFNVRGRKFVAFEDVSLKIEKGEFVCILGASGCGKSTLLNVIAGFVPATEGSVVIDGVEVQRPSTRRVMIFQNYGLLPWRTVVGNVELGLEQNPNLSKKERRSIAEKYVELVGLSSFRKSYPRQLSGGMQQRVSIARALAVKPDVVFMDEPFGALDAITRMKLQDDVLKISQEEKTTIVFVTHDIGEAVYLADRIVILSSSPGRVKCVINVPEGRDFRNRASDSFANIQKKALELFNLAPTRDPIEYYIYRQLKSSLKEDQKVNASENGKNTRRLSNARDFLSLGAADRTPGKRRVHVSALRRHNDASAKAPGSSSSLSVAA